MLGLRKRPTYDEVINYLENEQPKIKYPDRKATFLRNSPYLTQFDGDSWIDLEEQENNIAKEKLKEEEVKKIASATNATAQVLRATTRTKLEAQRLKLMRSTRLLKQNKNTRTTPNAPTTEMFDISMDDGIDETVNDVEMEEEQQKENISLKHEKIKTLVKHHLGDVEEAEKPIPMSSSSSSSAIPMEVALEEKKTSCRTSSNYK